MAYLCILSTMAIFFSHIMSVMTMFDNTPDRRSCLCDSRSVRGMPSPLAKKNALIYAGRKLMTSLVFCPHEFVSAGAEIGMIVVMEV